MAALGLDGCRAHTLRDEALQLGVDGAVVLGHDVPTRLRPPGCTCHLLVEQVRGRHALRCPNNLLLLAGEVSRERADASGPKPYTPVCDLDMREDFRRGEFIYQALRSLVVIRGECCDVHQ